MKHSLALLLVLVCALLSASAQSPYAVVADSTTRKPLPSASVFDRKGQAIGLTGADGTMPFTDWGSYPVTVRYIGYAERNVPRFTTDTIFLSPVIAELPEFLVETRNHKVMHILAYVREFSTLTTFTDTVFLYRRKMVDFMINPDSKSRFKGWSNPRVLASESYYHFTDKFGLDSVSDVSRHHFSWADWIGVVSAQVPSSLFKEEFATDTVKGKYSAVEIWNRNDYRVNVDVNVLADSSARKWVPNLKSFFRKDLEFESFRLRLAYDNITDSAATPMDLSGYSFDIQSAGRGHEMFRFNRRDEQYYVSTYGEVYVIDKEYITVKEARKWEKHDFSREPVPIIEPQEAPVLQPELLAVVERVRNIDREELRINEQPDRRLLAPHLNNKNFWLPNRALFMLKDLLGITAIKSHRNAKKQWNEQRDRIKKNTSRM